MKHSHDYTQKPGAPHWRGYRSVLAACLWMALATGTSNHAVAQQELNQPAPTQPNSKKEQLARGLEALRAARSQPAVNGSPEKQQELFLDLTAEPATAAIDAESSQGMAATLNVSMASSPTQVIMRAVAWISIVLCVCCLAILAARRWQRERGLLPTTTSRSRVLETLSLGPSRTVSLIEMHGYRALVATDAGGIRSLVLAPSTFEESLMQEEEITNDQ
jgi:flagellar biogenesis protein FliO